MFNPLIIGLIVFAVILAGAFAGWVLRHRLPEHQLCDETKSTVTVSMAVVATFSALVLGLLISNASTSFSALGGEVTTLSAQILRLDKLLGRYGPETGLARETLRPGRPCDSMLNSRLPICFPTITQIYASLIRRHTNSSSSLRIRYLG